ncbi:hypothetical protein HWB30_gp42 [Pseudomonas phage BrSP1]|uniref:Uncharacterized protein n=1 Tax=Pseudomonas phage BrSP1 TaxID=2029635 RepID=A0A343KJW2_9CAUD|nr:hypothetical protein HWB30_gp42 [Pseudomonas phage BrSP1]ATI16225.1 hypothetical protein BrSP1_42 [Pseudomonas phage BrSP1]
MQASVGCGALPRHLTDAYSPKAGLPAFVHSDSNSVVGAG